MAEKEMKKKEEAPSGTVLGDPETPSQPGSAATIDKTPPPAVDTDAVVEQWFRDFIPNSPASRTVECYNHLYRAKEVLKARLKGE